MVRVIERSEDAMLLALKMPRLVDSLQKLKNQRKWMMLQKKYSPANTLILVQQDTIDF